MGKIKLYYHTGSSNHGCEAIVRGTKNILNKDLELYSFSAEDEFKYKVDEVVKIFEDIRKPLKKNSLQYLISAFFIKFFKKTWINTYFSRKNFFSKVKKNDIYLSVGGDNYTYQGVWQLADYNKLLRWHGAKTVLWCCSIDAEIIPRVKKDLNKYNLIIARETLTYNALKNNNIKTRIELSPDPAFNMEKEIVNLPNGFNNENTIGLNLSPLILRYGNNDLIIRNFEKLINYILNNTNFNTLLIPHVVSNNNNDKEVLKIFFNKFKSTKRFFLLNDLPAKQLKGYISQCKFFIGARTHSTIAAYSAQVPTIAIGYSMKAKGIAKDIFGTHDNYVYPVQNLKTEDELINAFKWLQQNESRIRKHYKEFMPNYIENTKNAERNLKELINE